VCPNAVLERAKDLLSKEGVKDKYVISSSAPYRLMQFQDVVQAFLHKSCLPEGKEGNP